MGIDCYHVPQYWDLAFDEDTELEADFLEAAARRYGIPLPLRLFEPGCGGGRLILELARRGHQVSGLDLSEPAVRFAQHRLQEASLSADVSVGDMRTQVTQEPADIAYCLVNTFRHLLTEVDAVRHLQTVCDSLKPGGLYIIGMHLLPPDADEEDSEEWSAEVGGVSVDMRLDVVTCSRETRLETLRFQMTVSDPDHSAQQVFESDYVMRTYEADQMRTLLNQVPEFMLRDVYDFWYDIDEPLELSDELGDTVFVLQKRSS
ncbi:MAG: class I SAM-dependent methyltransferase [Planctomycetaceae bacterium]